jgi:hypothetical protein
VTSRRPIQQVLKRYRTLWDNPQIPLHTRKEFEKVIKCGTGALGYSIFRSESGEKKKVPFTCKSKACSSCGRKATLDWVRKMTLQLPDVPYASVMFSMPDTLWGMLASNREVLSHLPAIGAGALQDWARRKYQAEVIIIAVLHTFGGDFRFKPHLHVLVSRIGLNPTHTRLVEGIEFSGEFLWKEWKHSLVNHLRDLQAHGLLRSTASRGEVTEYLNRQYDYWCKVGIKDTESVDSFVGYMARYLRRPPIANRNIISIDNGTVVFLGKDTKAGKRMRMEVSANVFLSRLSDQVTEHYTNGVHYFGLVSPAAKRRGYRTFMGLLGREVPKPLDRMTWRGCMIREFGIDPLLDSNGEVMSWERNIIPKRN